MQAVIMSGGEGTRLRPLTCNMPKPMVPVLNKPSMEYIINLLQKINIKDISVTTYYLSSKISDHFGNGENLNVNLQYYVENTPLGTGGSVLNINHFPDDTFIVISGDCVTDIDLQAAIDYHKSKKSKATLLLKRVSNPLEYGIVIVDDNGRIIRFLEKPGWSEVFSDTVNTGIYILEPEIFHYFTKGENFDFSKDLFPKLLKNNIPMYGYVSNSYWNDVGDLASYRQTHFDILDGLITLGTSGHQVKPGVFAGNNTVISKAAIINPPVQIGQNCVISEGCILDSHTIIGDNCVIEPGSSLKRSILWNNVHIGRNSHCRGSIIGNNVILEDNVNLYENSIVACDCHIKNGASIKPDVKIWPSKKIRENASISANLVWNSSLDKVLFGNIGIRGEANTDITPEYALLLGSTFASTIKRQGPMVISTDGTALSNYIKVSMVSGILSTGTDIISLDGATTAESRLAVQFFNASAGIHIRVEAGNAGQMLIELFNSKGANIDRKTQKSVEQLFYRGDISRCMPSKIGKTTNIDNFRMFYNQHHKANLRNLPELLDRNTHILLWSRSNLICDAANTYLISLGCNVSIFNQSFTDDSFSTGLGIGDIASSMSTEMKAHHYDIGVMIDDSGEKLTVFDQNGNSVSGDRYNALVALIALKSGNIKKLILPINTTSTIKKLAESHNIDVVPTKSSITDIMNEMLNPTIETSSSGCIQFTLNFDAIAATGIILDFLAGRSITLDKLISELPDFHMRHISVECDFESRGYIVRKLIEESIVPDQSLELFEGVRINTESGWSLVLPDNERPILNIYSEGYNEEYAEELAVATKNKINSLLDSGKS